MRTDTEQAEARTEAMRRMHRKYALEPRHIVMLPEIEPKGWLKEYRESRDTERGSG